MYTRGIAAMLRFAIDSPVRETAKFGEVAVLVSSAPGSGRSATGRNTADSLLERDVTHYESGPCER